MKPHNRKLIDFILNDVLDVTALTKADYYSEHSKETFDLAIDMTEGIAEKYLFPHLASSDRLVPQLKDGKLTVHPELKHFVKAAAEAGITGATLPFEYGGQQLPKTVFGAMEYVQLASHNSFVMYTDLVNGCSGLIQTYASEEQKAQFLPNMLATKWLGTMCLTEPQAGSALSEVKTIAYLQTDGTYKIEGQKIFISAGDHNLAENIINLVLARIKGAPEGTKGISLFIVPKFKLDSGASNDVESIAAIHKMGQKATAAMHLGFGGNNNCEGYLLGEANKGLTYMFQMMNAARLGVGMTGISIASCAYYHSLQYAHERAQGKALTGGKTSIKIIKHPDVRRMLLHQKAIYEGGLAFMMQCYTYLDFEKTRPEAKERYSALAELLTPVAKSFGAEMGIEAANEGLQVLGGYGYTEDFILEQLTRDARICSIYEGTTGIHSLAVLGREIMGSQGKVLEIWGEEVANTVKLAAQHDELKSLIRDLKEELHAFKDITTQILTIAAGGKIEKAMADSVLYLEYFGYLNIAWTWLNLAQVALSKSDIDEAFKKSTIQTAKYYFDYILPRSKGLFATLTKSSELTIFDAENEILI
jgi:alkylation response protein AidB-like acyl-CoA dehydrogenase